MDKIRVAVLFGGCSDEHEISLRSAASIFANIDTERFDVFPIGITKAGVWYYYNGCDLEEIESGRWEQNKEHKFKITPVISKGENHFLAFGQSGVMPLEVDCVFPVLHGTEGEDGVIQGLFQAAGIPCVGCGVLASASAMEKSVTKLVVDHIGIRQAAFAIVTRAAFEKDPKTACTQVLARLGHYPVFVKPSANGSSVGTGKATDEEGLVAALTLALAHGNMALVEEFISGKEIEIAVLGNDDPLVSVAGEIVPSREFYTYESKYVDNSSQLYIPARIDDAAMKQVQESAEAIYKALGCRGMARVDFFYTQAGEIVFNEINTIPGFTSISMYPKLMDHMGIGYSDLLSRLIDLAIEV